MSKSLALTFPGDNDSTSSGKTLELQAPSGIPKNLQGGGLSSSGIVQTGLNLLFIGAVLMAVVFILISGISIITSGGDSNKLAQAKRRLLFSVLGLVVSVLAFFIVRFAISILGGDSKFLLLK